MARAPSKHVLSSAGLAGLQISVATRDIRREFASGKQQRRAYRRADRQRKSALALELAQATGGVIVNTDSMQG